MPTRVRRRSTGSDDEQVTWDCWSGGSVSAIIAYGLDGVGDGSLLCIACGV